MTAKRLRDSAVIDNSQRKKLMLLLLLLLLLLRLFVVSAACPATGSQTLCYVTIDRDTLLCPALHYHKPPPPLYTPHTHPSLQQVQTPLLSKCDTNLARMYPENQSRDKDTVAWENPRITTLSDHSMKGDGPSCLRR